MEVLTLTLSAPTCLARSLWASVPAGAAVLGIYGQIGTNGGATNCESLLAGHESARAILACGGSMSDRTNVPAFPAIL